MEAWIEIETVQVMYSSGMVASFVEAWIEILKEIEDEMDKLVASFVEAWIEMLVRSASFWDTESRLLRGGVD